MRQIKIGEIAPDPIRSEVSYVIVKRVEPPPRGDVSVRFDLPAPAAPDVVALIRSRDDAFMKDELRRVGEAAQRELALSEPLARQIAELHGGPGRLGLLDTPDSRGEVFGKLLTDVKGVLTPEAYSRYSALLDAHFAKILLASH